MMFKHVNVDLAECLARDLKFDYLRARRIARKKTLDEFLEELQALETIVGLEAADRISKAGSFADYVNSTRCEYFRLARIAAGQLGYLVPKDKESVFYSVESLRSYFTEEEQQNPVDSGRLKVADLRILHDNPASRGYLDSLIESGSLEVSDHEHWSNSANNETGARGLNILKVVKLQLREMFDQLGLEPPQVSINYGQGILTIPEEYVPLLRDVKEQVDSKNY